MNNEEVMDMEISMEQEENMEQDRPVFVCDTVIDVHTQLEAVKFTVGKRNKGFNIAMYMGFVIMVGYLVLDSVMNQRWQANAFSFVLVGAIMVFLLVSRFSSPKKAMAHWEEAMIKKYGSPAIHINTEFYELSLAQSLREDEEQFVCAGYSSIQELVETENLFLLRHGKDQYYFVAKNGFRVGTADQFRSFMEQRMGGK